MDSKQLELDDKGLEVKVKKVTDKDYKKIESTLKEELTKRKTSNYRQSNESKWKEVDRQVALETMDVGGNPESTWINTFELGTLAKASEIMTSDLKRIVFPEMRSWYEPHIEVPTELDPQTGEKEQVPKKFQDQVDGRLRAMMTQQHIDFGLVDRVELSIKEALHHGGFVAEVVEDSLDMYFEGTDVKEITSPVWKPHSMWNCYPDPSPSLVGSNMFYTGTMFIEQYMPRHKFLEQAVGEGWIPKNLKKVPKDENVDKENRTKDLKLVYYWGDLTLSRGETTDISKEDMFIPRAKCITANGKLVFLDVIKTPYPPLIYQTYERMDVRDPYGTSPIIKQSPMQKVTSILANEFVNGVQLQTRPPIVYDGNDPDFVVNGGPEIYPGAKTSTKGSANYKVLEIGDPKAALEGLEYGIASMKESLGRPGTEVGDRATATEVNTKQADSESGPFGFAVKMDNALRTFLYIQHYMNLSRKDFAYSYYNPEVDSPDFLRSTHKDLPKTVNFEVVGTKGMLGEQRRQQAFLQATSFATTNPIFAPLVEPEESLKQIYTDAGVKNSERFMKQGDIPPDLKAKMDGMMGVIQQLQGQLKDSESQNQVKMQKMNLDYKAKEDKINAQHSSEIAHLADKHMTDANNNESRVNQALKDAENLVRDVEHKIELIMAEERVKSSVSKEKEGQDKESKVTQDLIKVHEELKQGMQELAKNMVRPRKLVRDEQGRATGSEVQ
jgi:hypothetical protein